MPCVFRTLVSVCPVAQLDITKLLADDKGQKQQDAPPESTIYVVTFSGVTSGGMVTSGTICWTYKDKELVRKSAAEIHKSLTWAT